MSVPTERLTAATRRLLLVVVVVVDVADVVSRRIACRRAARDEARATAAARRDNMETFTRTMAHDICAAREAWREDLIVHAWLGRLHVRFLSPPLPPPLPVNECAQFKYPGTIGKVEQRHDDAK